MPDARINAAAIRIEPADDDVIDSDERGENTHRADQPERRVARYGKRQADDIRFARAPVPVENRRRARDVHIARTFNGWDHRYPWRARAALLNVNDFLTLFASGLINALSPVDPPLE